MPQIAGQTMTALRAHALMLVQLFSTADGKALVLHSVWTLLIWVNLHKHYKDSLAKNQTKHCDREGLI